MDRRIQKTRNAIFTAFSNLLAQKKYSRITIQDIIDDANIGRSTFYSHFETKEELLKLMCTDIFEHVFSDQLFAEKTHDFSVTHDNTRSVIMHILYHLRDSKRDISGLFTSESGDLFMDYFKDQLTQQLCPCLLNISENRTGKLPEDFLSNHITGSFVAMISWWMNRGMPETPEELTGYYLDAVLPLI